MNIFDWLAAHIGLLGGLTVAVCFLGAAILFRHWLYFRNSESKLAKRLRHVFATDALIYASTASFGILSWIGTRDAGEFGWAYVVRLLALLANIYAAWRLFNHYRVLEDETGRD